MEDLIAILDEIRQQLHQCALIFYADPAILQGTQLPTKQSKSETYELTSKNAADGLKAKLTLLAENVIMAEVQFKHPKTTGGHYRGTAQPEVQWKLTQIQDARNLCQRSHDDVRALIQTLIDEPNLEEPGRAAVREVAESIKVSLLTARNTLTIPKKRSLLELYHFAPTKKFQPPLSQDVLLSFYVSGAKIVCASYQMLAKSAAPTQSLAVSVAECPLDGFDHALYLLSASINNLQQLVHLIEAI
ncbi:unnamed protein product, partial [Mesorhabditis spiculigera]